MVVCSHGIVALVCRESACATSVVTATVRVLRSALCLSMGERLVHLFKPQPTSTFCHHRAAGCGAGEHLECDSTQFTHQHTATRSLHGTAIASHPEDEAKQHTRAIQHLAAPHHR